MLDDKTWEFFDIKDGKEDKCPNCNSSGCIVFALHNPIITGYKFSAMCKNCRYEENSMDPKFTEDWVLD